MALRGTLPSGTLRTVTATDGTMLDRTMLDIIMLSSSLKLPPTSEREGEKAGAPLTVNLKQTSITTKVKVEECYCGHLPWSPFYRSECDPVSWLWFPKSCRTMQRLVYNSRRFFGDPPYEITT